MAYSAAPKAHKLSNYLNIISHNVPSMQLSGNGPAMAADNYSYLFFVATTLMAGDGLVQYL